MANEYLQMKNKNSEQFIALNVNVFESIIRNVIENDTYTELEDRKALDCRIVNNELKVVASIHVLPGFNAITTSEFLQEAIFKEIYQLTDIQCYDININITGFIF